METIKTKWKFWSENAISKMKKFLNWINIRLETPEERVSELEERLTDIIKSEEQTEERWWQLKRDSPTYRIIVSSFT